MRCTPVAGEKCGIDAEQCGRGGSVVPTNIVMARYPLHIHCIHLPAGCIACIIRIEAVQPRSADRWNAEALWGPAPLTDPKHLSQRSDTHITVIFRPFQVTLPPTGRAVMARWARAVRTGLVYPHNPIDNMLQGPYGWKTAAR